MPQCIQPCTSAMDRVATMLVHAQAIFTAGYKAILHLHSLVEECEITKLLAQIDVKTKERKKVRGLVSAWLASQGLPHVLHGGLTAALWRGG